MSARYRSRADGPLLALLGLSLAFVIAQGWFVARQTLPYAPLVACQTWLATWLARLTNLGVLLPAATSPSASWPPCWRFATRSG